MKKLLLLAVFLLSLGAVTNQWFVMSTYTGTSIWHKAYTASTLDTTQWYGTGNFKSMFVTLASEDSASIHIYYQLGIRIDSALGAWTLKDSLNTDSNTGNIKTLDMSSTIGGAPYVRFYFKGKAFRLGTSTAYYSASWMAKED